MFAIVTNKRSRFLQAARLVLVLLCLVGTCVAVAANPRAGGDKDGKILSTSGSSSGWFTILEMKPVGEILHVTYKIRYPGMTKVRLYEGQSENPVWRGQYVNQKEGTYTVKFNISLMKRGQEYRFEFDYKNTVEPRFFTP